MMIVGRCWQAKASHLTTVMTLGLTPCEQLVCSSQDVKIPAPYKRDCVIFNPYPCLCEPIAVNGMDSDGGRPER